METRRRSAPTWLWGSASGLCRFHTFACVAGLWPLIGGCITEKCLGVWLAAGEPSAATRGATPNGIRRPAGVSFSHLCLWSAILSPASLRMAACLARIRAGLLRPALCANMCRRCGCSSVTLCPAHPTVRMAAHSGGKHSGRQDLTVLPLGPSVHGGFRAGRL